MGRRMALRLPWLALVAVLLSPSAPLAQEWIEWDNLGGAILDAPECVSWGPNRLDCFARNTDQGLAHIAWDGSNWSGWESLGGIILDRPSCVSWGPDRIDCFARDLNRQLVHKAFDGANWWDWENLGGILLDRPSCVSWGPNRIHCFARDLNRQMVHRWFEEGNWQGWENLGGILLEAPECISRASNIDCFARDLNKAMVRRWYDGHNWQGWENLGGILLEAPDCVSWSFDRIDCFARGTDAAMKHQAFDGIIWGGWEDLGGTILEAPECVSWGPGRLDCFARDTNRGIVHRSFDGSIFKDWESLGGTILEAPECVSWGPYRLDCFARDTNRAMLHFALSCPRCARNVHLLKVRVHFTTALSGLEVDRITADASRALQTIDGPGDVACPVRFIRYGLTGFSFPDGSIDSESEFEAVLRVPDQVKVMHAINWCKGVLQPGLIGCAPTPGGSFAVVRTTPSLEGLLWAHEFGHNMGLGHRDNDPNAIMNGNIGPTRRRVNLDECVAFINSPFTPASEDEPLMSKAGFAGLPDVREFVRQVFIHGVPYEQARRYPAAVVPILAEMLGQPGEEAAWTNIAVTLGMIGDDSAVKPLIDFIEAGASARLSHEHYRARTSAVMSLGYIINQTGSRLALDYLTTGLEPSAWESRLGSGIASFQASDSERNRDFSKHALLGLALSGRPEAAQALRELQRPTGKPPSAFAVVMNELLSEALNEHSTIAAKGLEGYYRATPP